MGGDLVELFPQSLTDLVEPDVLAAFLLALGLDRAGALGVLDGAAAGAVEAASVDRPGARHEGQPGPDRG